MFDARTDPAGASLKARAGARRDTYRYQNLGKNMGPLSDPAWDGFMQAMGEAGVSGLADNSVGVKKGMFSPGAAYQPTYNPLMGQSSAVDAMPSVGIGSSTQGAIDGLDRAIGTPGGFELRKPNPTKPMKKIRGRA